MSNYLVLVSCLLLLVAASHRALCQQEANFPYYLQSPVNPSLVGQDDQLVQRSLYVAAKPRAASGKLKLAAELSAASEMAPTSPAAGECLYEKQYFAKLDECLARRPYPSVGLLAFKNEDLLVKRGLGEKHGCQFLLNNGLFKNYQIAKYSVESDGQCLDGTKVALSMSFFNISQSYLWTLRCLNRADQLLDDATMDGRTVELNEPTTNGDESARSSEPPSICVGSSQNFGFTSLQLNGIEAQVELASDIYRNWQVTNVTVAMISSLNLPPVQFGEIEPPLPGTNIKDFTFESLDGDELNWRYLPMFQNWTRNRMHTNFLDQFRRFLWISLQRCLSESSGQLPVKLVNVFSGHKYQ